jgi:hypothetical protein
MPGVTVTAKNNAAGVTRTEVTDEKGGFGSLAGGFYSITAHSGLIPRTGPVVLAIDHGHLDFT